MTCTVHAKQTKYLDSVVQVTKQMNGWGCVLTHLNRTTDPVFNIASLSQSFSTARTYPVPLGELVAFTDEVAIVEQAVV